MSLNDTPRAMRLHIGLFGRRNSGKSSLVNALTGQQVATVSAVPGTTTDPVYKSMEIHGIGPVVFVDTAGFDDEGALGELRVDKTRQAAEATDIALVLFDGEDMEEELLWLKKFHQQQVPAIPVLSRMDERGEDGERLARRIEDRLGRPVIRVSASSRQGIELLREEIMRELPEDYRERTITGGVVAEGRHVLLVMPQDIQAPKGRLILPQVQTLRELLDRKCLVSSCTTDRLPAMLAALREAPDLVITDSQAFRIVHDTLPEGTLLTSFSVLFAAYKGDIDFFVQGAEALLQLPGDARILIAEACTHKPLQEDIGRVKLPRMLRRRFGDALDIRVVSGRDFPQDLAPYDLVIHCGACMFNRQYVLSRVAACRAQGVPMTNYGVAIAALLGILPDVRLPHEM